MKLNQEILKSFAKKTNTIYNIEQIDEAFDWKKAIATGSLLLASLIGMQARPLIDAIGQVESNGRIQAVGDNGLAKGIFQIQPIVIKDVNRIYGTHYTHDDAFDPVKAKDIFDKYTSHWAKYYHKKTGKPITDEVIARIWNGGPKWFLKAHKTDNYWNKVKKELAK